MSDKQEKHPEGAGDTASPSAYFTHFEDGIGQIRLIAEMLIEATGHANPARIKRLGGESANAIVAQERFDATLKNYLRRSGSSSAWRTQQGDFNRRVQAMASDLLDTAQRENWRVNDKTGVRQQPPQPWGYIDVQLVHDLYANTKGKNHSVFAGVLALALQAQSTKESTQANLLIHHHSPTESLSDPKSRGLTSTVIAEVFGFYQLNSALSECEGHGKWLLDARVHIGGRSKPPADKAHRWCPIKVADALMKKKSSAYEMQLRKAFMEDPRLRPWRDEWQDARKERNSFGQ